MQKRLDRWLLAGTAALAVSSIGCAQLKQNVVEPSPYEKQLSHVLLSDRNPYYPTLQSREAAVEVAPTAAPRAAVAAPIARLDETNVPPRHIVSTDGAVDLRDGAKSDTNATAKAGLGFAGDVPGFGPDGALQATDDPTTGDPTTDDPMTVMVPLDGQPERPRAPKATTDVGLGDPGDGTVGEALPAVQDTTPTVAPAAAGDDQAALPDFDPAVEPPDFSVPGEAKATPSPAKAAPVHAEVAPAQPEAILDVPAGAAPVGALPAVARTPSRLDVMDEDPTDMPAGSAPAPALTHVTAPALTHVIAPAADTHGSGTATPSRVADPRSRRPSDAGPATLGPSNDGHTQLGDGSVKGEVLAAAQRLVGVKTPFDESRFLAWLLSAADLGIGDASDSEGFIKAVYEDLDKQQRTFGIGTEPSPGDLVFFSNTFDRDADGRSDDWFTMAGVVESVQGNGTVVFIGVCGGEVRRMVFSPGRPSAEADPSGESLNSALRNKSLSDRPFTKYLAGELFAAFGHLQDD